MDSLLDLVLCLLLLVFVVGDVGLRQWCSPAVAFLLAEPGARLSFRYFLHGSCGGVNTSLLILWAFGLSSSLWTSWLSCFHRSLRFVLVHIDASWLCRACSFVHGDGETVKPAARDSHRCQVSSRCHKCDCGSLPLLDAFWKKVRAVEHQALRGRAHHLFGRFLFTFRCLILFVSTLSMIACHFGTGTFDATCGYPGEGPVGNMILRTANIGSVQTNHDWKSWGCDILCLQETRIGKNNLKSATHAIRDAGYQAVLGHILPGLLHKVGRIHTPCGGTGVLASKDFIKPFVAQDDHTGLFQSLFDTKRIVIAWIQISPKRRALVVSVYATTGASNDAAIHESNDRLFQDLFELTAQFGSIPVIVAGDFQALPLSYPAVSNAVHMHNWYDPLHCLDDTGQSCRPVTFSNDGLFAGLGEGSSSIDGILLNQCAYFALESCKVIESFGRQHRPIECCFFWPSLEVVGYTLYKTAPLDVTNIPKNHWDPKWAMQPHNDRPPGLDEWSDVWENQFQNAPDPELKWDVVNKFCVESLLQSGATWGEGPHERAKPARFCPKQICPPQHRNHCAATRKSASLFKLQNRLDELLVRRTRGYKSDQDRHVFRVTSAKVFRSLHVLHAPLLWPRVDQVTLVHIQVAKSWVLQEIQNHMTQVKNARIQSWKHRIQTSAKHGCNYIFRHLKNKLLDEPANLVEDDHGNILYQPDAALQHLNNKWDDVYGANVGFDHPIKMLHTVWPYIQDKVHQANLPQIDAEALYKTVQRRKTEAAPGLDGWRTCELQALPPQCFIPIARFFRWIEHHPQLDLPEALTRAKQIILNKPGAASAMNKRLITILPALLLSYTGARFEQLQAWQIAKMPSCIIGGVKGRTMPSLHTALRLEIDVARASRQDLVGIKLDKAKCFDRLIPECTAALFLAFGLPKTLVSFFVRIYKGLKRHIAYKGWISPTATTAANGVVQGCSLSLVAVNVHTKVWVHLLETLPTLSMRAYVDDAYLWCKIQHLADLSTALQITSLWDELVGQRLNAAKSTVWGTSRVARHAVAHACPDMKLEFVFDALGTRIYTSNKDDFHFETKTLEHVCQAVDCIGALPLPVNIRAHLIGAKAIPKLTYGAHISRTPKAALQKVQNGVTRALWRGRPKIRAKHLVLTFFGKPHRIDPFIAQAYNCVLDIFRYCFDHPDTIDKLKLIDKNQRTAKNSLVAALQRACDILHLSLLDDFSLQFQGADKIILGSCGPRDFAKVLQAIALQAQYFAVQHKKRKDVCKPSGLVDVTLSTAFLRKPTFATPTFPTATMHFESVLVGCTLTKDRLCASGWVEDHMCRFCGQAKETMAHLVFACTSLHRLISTPTLHEFGANFSMLGIFEHPSQVARHRLCQDVTLPPCEHDFPPESILEEVWTDGSVMWTSHFWITTAAFAVIDSDGAVKTSGRVKALRLNSYTAELWAVCNAFATSRNPVIVYTDSQSVVDNIAHMIKHDGILPTWACLSWWTQLHKLWHHRKQIFCDPLQVCWIPSHCLEHVSDTDLTESAAQALGTTVRHILRNRQADREAKRQALLHAPVDPKVQRLVTPATLLHQEWLTRLHCHLDTRQQIGEPNLEPTQGGDSHQPSGVSLTAAIASFSKWPWNSHLGTYKWKPKIPDAIPVPKRWRSSTSNWHTVCDFLRTLRWTVQPGNSTAFCELAVHFHASGFQLDDHDEMLIHDVYTLIRQCLQWLAKTDGCQPFPGDMQPGHAKSVGKVLCQGAITGASAYLSNHSLHLLACALQAGAGRASESWKLHFPALPS